MRPSMVKAQFIRGRSIASTLLVLLALGGCKYLHKTDSAPDAQALVIASASAAPAAASATTSAAPAVSSAPPVASIAPVIPAVAATALATHTHVETTTKTKTSTATSTAATAGSAKPAASAAGVASVKPVASVPGVITPPVSSDCRAACQKTYRECASQTGTLVGVELVRKCRAALVPCLASCN